MMLDIGFRPRVNRITKFNMLMRRITEGVDLQVLKDPNWLGQPYKFHIPYLAFEPDPEDHFGQVHVIKVKTTGMYYLDQVWNVYPELIYKDPVLYFSDDIETGYIVAHEPGSRLELASVKLLTKDGHAIAKVCDPLMKTYTTDDVETILSSYFTICAMQDLKIGALRKSGN